MEEKERETEIKKEKFNCECIKCKHKMESDKHCNEIKCPKCGGEMRRAERPGPGKEIKEKFSIGSDDETVRIAQENWNFMLAELKELKQIIADLKETRILSGKDRQVLLNPWVFLPLFFSAPGP
ncbi:hypothetical protein ES705_39055 [subsurface metagenome]